MILRSWSGKQKRSRVAQQHKNGNSFVVMSYENSNTIAQYLHVFPRLHPLSRLQGKSWYLTQLDTKPCSGGSQYLTNVALQPQSRRFGQVPQKCLRTQPHVKWTLFLRRSHTTSLYFTELHFAERCTRVNFLFRRAGAYKIPVSALTYCDVSTRLEIQRFQHNVRSFNKFLRSCRQQPKSLQKAHAFCSHDQGQ